MCPLFNTATNPPSVSYNESCSCAQRRREHMIASARSVYSLSVSCTCDCTKWSKQNLKAKLHLHSSNSRERKFGMKNKKTNTPAVLNSSLVSFGSKLWCSPYFQRGNVDLLTDWGVLRLRTFIYFSSSEATTYEFRHSSEQKTVHHTSWPHSYAEY